MRLTLRTLLAYIDDILDPSDHEELSRKIESSEFATELIHRSRDTVRRLRLGAPDPRAGDSDDVLGGDGNWDANSVAEYLDNTLAPERVAEFEQQCLEQGPESDMLLAETTSCHHILTMVLGEPADVDSSVRQRLYRLGADSGAVVAETITTGQGTKARVEPAHVLGAPPAQAAEAPQPPAQPAEQPASDVAAAQLAAQEAEDRATQEHVPDYLRVAAAHDRSRRRYVALAAVLVIAAGLAFAFWPPRERDGQSGADVGPLAQSNPRIEQGSGAPMQGDSGQTPTTDPGAVSSTGNQPIGPATGDTSTGTDDRAPAEPIAELAADSPPPVATPSLPTGGKEGSDRVESNGFESDRDEPTGLDVAPAKSSSVADDPQNVETASQPSEDEAEQPRDESTAVDSELDLLSFDPADLQDPSDTPGPFAESPQRDGEVDDATVQAESDREMASPDFNPPLDATAGASEPLDGQLASNPAPNVPPLPQPSSGDEPVMEIDASDAGSATSADAATADLLIGQDDAAEQPVEPEGPRTIGNYLGNGDVLLVQAPTRDAWVRLPMGSQLTEGDRLLALPTMRAHAVIQDMNVFLGGGTVLALGQPGAEGGSPSETEAMQLRRGRVLVNAGLSGNRFELFVGGQRFEVDMDPSSSLAVQRRLKYNLGSEDRSEAQPDLVEWHATSGSVSVTGPQGSLEVAGPSTWTTQGDDVSSVSIVGRLPAWITGEPVTDLERNARDQITEALTPGQDVEITLLEFADKSSRGRRRENRTVATACCAYIGQFEPFVRALSDGDLRAYWEDLLTAVRDTLAVDPAKVEDLHDAFRSLRGETAAPDLVALTLGYELGPVGDAPTEQQGRLLRQLVRWMDHDQLDYRVLALHNLNELTGVVGRGGYRPWHAEDQRARSLRHYADIDNLWTLVQTEARTGRN